MPDASYPDASYPDASRCYVSFSNSRPDARSRLNTVYLLRSLILPFPAVILVASALVPAVSSLRIRHRNIVHTIPV
jgi:hypothetical protein